MTNREAIERIKDHMRVHNIGRFKFIEFAEALNMATEALSTLPERDYAKPLTEEEIRARVGEVVVIVRETESGTLKVSKAIVDIFDYRDEHALILWKFRIRDHPNLSGMERNCLLLPFGKPGWEAFDMMPIQFDKRYQQRIETPPIRMSEFYARPYDPCRQDAQLPRPRKETDI